MKLVVSGSSGLIGSALIPYLENKGHRVTRLVRSTAHAAEPFIHWDPIRKTVESAQFEDFDGIVHLAGENVASKRWSNTQKDRIRNSRIDGTRLLSEILAMADKPPKVLVCASAIGFYGDRGDKELTEACTPGNGLLADTCVEWEKSTQPAVEKGIRVVHLRIGVVMSPRGGALKKMLMPFKMGVGGKIGNGHQYISWIAIDDVVRAIYQTLTMESLNGPINAVSPNPVTNEAFTKTLGKVLHRPTIFPMPAFAARLAFGQMADELLLASTRVQPEKLLKSGFEFEYPKLEKALRALL